jgi:putative zinc finger/helix-turn-helix YgiT family protein
MNEFTEIGHKIDICPNCEEEREIKLGKKKETLIINKEPFEIEAQVEYCPTCKEYFADTETEEANIQKAYYAYREAHELLQPNEIQKIREKYGLSQRTFSRLLGWGEITLHRYEAGGVQDEAHNNELILIDDPENFSILFDRYRDKLSPHQIHRVEKRLGELPEKEFTKCFSDALMYRNVDIYSGFLLFDEEKFENAVLYFTSKLKTPVYKTKLNKLLWYFDFINFKTTSVSVTGCAYVHARYGPVPESYDFLIGSMIANRSLEAQEVVFDQENDVAGEILSALEEPDLSAFSMEEKANLEKVASSLGSLTSAQISKMSHDEEGYKKTEDWEKISYDWAKDLKIPLG